MTDEIRFTDVAEKTRAIEKRMRHKIVAREIRKRPELVDQALTVLNQMIEEKGDHPQFMEWRAILQKPPHVVAREIVKLTQKMEQLRKDSPFYLMRAYGLDFTDEDERRKLSRAAKAEAEADDSDVIFKPGR